MDVSKGCAADKIHLPKYILYIGKIASALQTAYRWTTHIAYSTPCLPLHCDFS
mgnify:CR=1 FL=1